MVFRCRNPVCIYHSRPIDVAIVQNECPKCRWKLLGDSPSLDDPLDPPRPDSSPIPAEPKPEPPRTTPAPKAGVGFLSKLIGLGKAKAELPIEKQPAALPAEKSEPSAAPPKPSRKRKGQPKPNPKSPTPPVSNPPPSSTGGLDVRSGKKTLPEIVASQKSIKKPRYVLERIYRDRVEPLDFIDEQLPMPLYRNDANVGRIDIASIKSTAMGMELTPFDSPDGVFVRIKKSRRLVHGSRFSIGDYLIEVRLPTADPVGRPVSPFPAKDLKTSGVLVFLRSDGSDGVSFPLLRKVVIGRGGPEDKPVDIPLLDEGVSRLHAAVTPFEGGLKLQDLESMNGTFLQIKEPTYLDDRDSFRLGENVLRLVKYPAPKEND